MILGDFMELELAENSWDGIYSATAFHWLPPEAALEKVLRLLKRQGCLALFWNHPYPNRLEIRQTGSTARSINNFVLQIRL